MAAVLAAGAGRRVGGPKALLSLDGSTFVARCVEALRRPGVDAVVVVVAHDDVADEARRAGAEAVLRNERPDDGMLGSALLALGEARRRGASSLLLHPVDHPLVAPSTVDAVIGALAQGARVAVPSFENRRGHPVGFSPGAWDALRAASPGRGARAVLLDHPEWVVHVEGDRGCRLGVNTPEDYAAAVRSNEGGTGLT